MTTGRCQLKCLKQLLTYYHNLSVVVIDRRRFQIVSKYVVTLYSKWSFAFVSSTQKWS